MSLSKIIKFPILKMEFLSVNGDAHVKNDLRNSGGTLRQKETKREKRERERKERKREKKRKKREKREKREKRNIATGETSQAITSFLSHH